MEGEGSRQNKMLESKNPIALKLLPAMRSPPGQQRRLQRGSFYFSILELCLTRYSTLELDNVRPAGE